MKLVLSCLQLSLTILIPGVAVGLFLLFADSEVFYITVSYEDISFKDPEV